MAEKTSGNTTVHTMSESATPSTLAATPSTAAPVAQSSSRLTARRVLRDPVNIAAIIVIVCTILMALFAPVIASMTGHGVSEQFRDTGLSPAGIPVGPNGEFVFGTDQLGRDILVRLAYGARVSLLVGVVASLAASVIGVVIGTVAGFIGGKTDTVLSRFVDLVMSVPFLLVAIALVAVFTPSLTLSISVIVFFSWAGLARVIRGQVLAIREREYIEAARSLGESRLSVMLRDVLPNLSVPIIVNTTLMVPSAIVFEATLSFLGLGIVPPTPSWGNMLADAANGSMYAVAPWMVLVPGGALLLLTLAFNLLGDGLQDALNPQSVKVPRRRLRRRTTSSGAVSPQADTDHVASLDGATANQAVSTDGTGTNHTASTEELATNQATSTERTGV